MKSTKSELQEIKEGSLIQDELGKIGLVRPAFYGFLCDVRPGTGRRRHPGLVDSERPIPYINHMANGLIKETSDSMDYWDVIRDMGQKRIDLPLLEQVGGTCVFYSAYTAMQIIDRKTPEIPEISYKDWCNTNMTREFKMLREYKGQYYSGDYGYTDQVKIREDILKYLPTNLILAGGNINIAKDRIYGDSKIPVFNFWETNAGHNVCIIGCYKDKQFGNCFITKMTNPRDDVGIPGEFGRNKINRLSYGIIPFKYYDGSFFKRSKSGKQGILISGVDGGLTITEFGYVPIKHDITRQLNNLSLQGQLKF